MSSTVVIGAGWAGLMCAYTLAKRGQQVTIIEAAPHIGGRARTINFADYKVDNGQHVCLGAYHTLFELLHELKLEPQSLFEILPMQLLIYGTKNLQIKFPKLLTPYNVIFAFLLARNLPWSAKYQILDLCRKLKNIDFKLARDCTLHACLKNYHQSDFVIKHVWEPIALATMTTPIDIASAQIFFNILRLCFDSKSSDSNWYIPKTDLSTLLPMQMAAVLQNFGCNIITGTAITKIELSASKCTSIHSSTNSWSADQIVISTPPWVAAKLLKPHQLLQATHAKLSKFTPQPIITIYYEFADAINLPYPITGMLNTVCQWVFDRSCAGQPNILSVIISGPGSQQHLPHQQLATTVLQELQAKFPHLKSPLKYKVINEKRAAFSCDFSKQNLRPVLSTEIQNLWLAGDYVQTGLPSTLEGALMSGKQTGEMICSQIVSTSNISPRSNQSCDDSNLAEKKNKQGDMSSS